jgi:histone acetyltransferase (RNA polymerase elongator complex component)
VARQRAKRARHQAAKTAASKSIPPDAESARLDSRQRLGLFKKLYSSPDYMPDMIKIYPCVVNRHADLYKLWKTGQYKSYTDKQLLELIIKIKKSRCPG